MRRRFSTSQRWLLLVASGSQERASRFRAILVVIGTGLLIASSTVPGLPLVLRVAASLLAVGVLVKAAMRRRSAARASGASIVADAAGLARLAVDGSKPIVKWDSPFGVALLASYGRSHGLLAFTTPTQTRYIPMRLDARSEADDELFARIAVLADLDFVDGVTHEAALGSSDAGAVIRHAEDRSGGVALGRLYLTDVRGQPISLDRGTLSVANRSFDLTSHLEWRVLMFHESTGQAVALYQATWIRQSGAEVVLVAPMPASVVPREPNAQREATGRLGRALTRDLRLLQAPVETPPSRDLRVAIDRPFMMAVRRALDEAPLASRVVLPTPKLRTEGRDSVV